MTAVTLAIGENGSKTAYVSHSAGTAHGARPLNAQMHGLLCVLNHGCFGGRGPKYLQGRSDTLHGPRRRHHSMVPKSGWWRVAHPWSLASKVHSGGPQPGIQRRR